MFAAVDLGSNSFRLHIGRHDGEAIRLLKSARDPVRLAAGLDQRGYLTERAMQSALESLGRFRDLLATYPLDAVRVVATNTLRVAKNSSTFLPAAERAIGYPIEIISGEEEGRLIYMGVASSLATLSEKRLVLDIGGGSTELILGKGLEIEHVESFSIGTVPQGSAFFAGGDIDASSFEAAILSARSRFEDAAQVYRRECWTNAYGTSGTIRAIADAISKNALGDRLLSRKSLEALKQRLVLCAHTSNIDLIGMKPDRAATMAGGLAIMIGLMQELNIETMIPIEAGLRMGVLWDLQLRATKRDRREQSVQEFLRRFHADVLRANRVADVASALYKQLKPVADTYARHVYWSGLLHEVGLAVSQSGYHKHSAYLIEHADLPGFTALDQRAMSTLILGQKGNLRKVSDALANADFAKAVLALRLAVMFMHSRVEVNLDELRLRMKNKIELETKGDWDAVHPTVSYWIEKEKEFWNQVGIELSVKAGA